MCAHTTEPQKILTWGAGGGLDCAKLSLVSASFSLPCCCIMFPYTLSFLYGCTTYFASHYHRISQVGRDPYGSSDPTCICCKALPSLTSGQISLYFCTPWPLRLLWLGVTRPWCSCWRSFADFYSYSIGLALEQHFIFLQIKIRNYWASDLKKHDAWVTSKIRVTMSGFYKEFLSKKYFFTVKWNFTPLISDLCFQSYFARYSAQTGLSLIDPSFFLMARSSVLLPLSKVKHPVSIQ